MVSKIDTYTSDSLPYHRKETSEKALSVRLRCLETCHAVRNLLHKCPEFRFDFAYAGTACKPSPLSTDTADMRSNLHRRERQSSHNPTSLKRAAEYLGRPSERRIRQKCFAATFWLERVRRLDLEYSVRICSTWNDNVNITILRKYTGNSGACASSGYQAVFLSSHAAWERG